MKIGIFGFGEVGRSIEKLIKDSHKFSGWYVEDPAIIKMPKPDYLDVIHICFPYSTEFTKMVSDIIVKFESHLDSGTLVIIHSTVPIGTTLKLSHFNEEYKIVHSPVRGVHPYLAEHMKQFTTFIGYDYLEDGLFAYGYLSQLGMKCELVKGSKNTEAGKLLGTTYYGICIEFHRLIKSICDEYNLNYHIVSDRFNQTYNEGYKESKPNVIRPVLYPPEGKIGGHCVLPNAEILNNQTESWIIKGILEENK